MSAFVLLHLLLHLLPLTSSWKLFGTKTRTTSRLPTTSLVEHLTQNGSASRINKAMEVVMISPHECGVQYHPCNCNSTPLQNIELAWIDRTEFVTPACGEQTLVGQALKAYLEDHLEIKESHRNALPSIYLAIFLCLAKNQQGPNRLFDQYLLTLPTISAMQHIPVFWSDASLRELQGCNVRDAILERKREWEQELDIVHHALQGQHHIHFDLRTWSWARSIITSRAFTDTGSSQHLCLVPYVDMLNHCGNADETHLLEGSVQKVDWVVEDNGFRLTLHQHDEGATNHYNNPDSSVEIAYGTLSNSQCLINYGFAILDDVNQTPHETAIISLTLHPSASEEKKALWKQDGIECSISRNVTLSIGNPGPMETLLSLCRVACCKLPHELQDMTTLFDGRAEATSQTKDGLVPQMAATLSRIPFSVANEILAMAMLQGAVLRQLKSYRTTLSQDNFLLEHPRVQRFWRRPSHANNVRNAVIVRRGEKRVLQHFYNVATFAIAYLSQPMPDFEEYKGLLESTLLSESPLGV